MSQMWRGAASFWTRSWSEVAPAAPFCTASWTGSGAAVEGHDLVAVRAPDDEPCCRPCDRGRRSQAASGAPQRTCTRNLSQRPTTRALSRILPVSGRRGRYGRWKWPRTGARMVGPSVRRRLTLCEVHDGRGDRDALLFGRVVGVFVAAHAVRVVVVVAQRDFEIADRHWRAGFQQRATCAPGANTNAGRGSIGRLDDAQQRRDPESGWCAPASPWLGSQRAHRVGRRLDVQRQVGRLRQQKIGRARARASTSSPARRAKRSRRAGSRSTARGTAAPGATSRRRWCSSR